MKKIILAFTIVALMSSCKREKGPQPVQIPKRSIEVGVEWFYVANNISYESIQDLKISVNNINITPAFDSIHYIWSVNCLQGDIVNVKISELSCPQDTALIYGNIIELNAPGFITLLNESAGTTIFNHTVTTL